MGRGRPSSEVRTEGLAGGRRRWERGGHMVCTDGDGLARAARGPALRWVEKGKTQCRGGQRRSPPERKSAGSWSSPGKDGCRFVFPILGSACDAAPALGTTGGQLLGFSPPEPPRCCHGALRGPCRVCRVQGHSTGHINPLVSFSSLPRTPRRCRRPSPAAMLLDFPSLPVAPFWGSTSSLK